MPVCLKSQPSCHASLKFAGYSNLLNGDILKMSNLKLSQPGVRARARPRADLTFFSNECRRGFIMNKT